ncbi:GTPase IMAP family member 8-like isoform X2 [Paramormyrops kingsleyae]|uniref:GTPase IMAP family member 8-like isoform X2 n=2 Tax=Paramormyrops kingsleyae TaxID=1676925 RepID=UPI003B969FBA
MILRIFLSTSTLYQDRAHADVHKHHHRFKKEMASSRHVQTQDLSELRIVLLGGRRTGKSSAGNTILGREEFVTEGRTVQCVKRQREVAGRQVTVVDTPGWWKSWSVENTPEADKLEIVHSVSLCPPGPCALLIVLRIDASFTETERRSVEEHLELLSGTVWRHTIVLFTRGDRLGDRTIEQHIEAEGEALRWLVGKCGNRYHVLNNQKRGDVTQVTELLEKVEEMVAGNSGRHYEIERMIIEKVEEKKRSMEERAKQRMMKLENQRKTLGALFKEQTQDLSELRIVLLGGRWTGKSSAGNTILGREEFVTEGRTVQCVKRQREVAGRQVTVVDTPGWWINWSVENTPEADKQEIVHSVSLCPPGPCALFIVLNVDASFTETDRRSVEGHLDLLSGTVWRHTIVLFTRGDWLGDRTIEQHIEAEGEALRWLVGKCGNRYHVLNNEKRGDVTQVTELLEKVEEMVAGNSGCHFEIDRMIIEKAEEKKKSVEERAKQRMMKVENQRKTLRALFKEQTQDLSELRIVLLGGRWTGKSSAGNTILGREEFVTEGRTVQCVKRQREVAGRQVTVVDTPGWWMNWSVESSLEADKQEIVHSVSLCPPGPCALFIVLRVDASFTETDRRSVEGHLELLSGTVWRHTIVLFTCGDWLGDRTIEQHIEAEGEALRWLVGKCGNRYHVLNNEKRGDVTQVTELLEKVEEMVAGNSGRHFTVGEREDSWEQLLERARIRKEIKQQPEEKWSRRKEKLIEMMSLLEGDTQTDQPSRRKRSSISTPPYFSGESSSPSESGSSVLDGELGYQMVSREESMRMEKYKARSSSSRYGLRTSAFAAPSEARYSELYGELGHQLASRKVLEWMEKNKARSSSSDCGTWTSAFAAPSETQYSVLYGELGHQESMQMEKYKARSSPSHYGPRTSAFAAPSEARYSVLDGELGHQLVHRKKSMQMEKYKARSSSSHYGPRRDRLQTGPAGSLPRGPWGAGGPWGP